jgi:aminoglycoside phosphotransferase family enzyme
MALAGLPGHQGHQGRCAFNLPLLHLALAVRLQPGVAAMLTSSFTRPPPCPTPVPVPDSAAVLRLLMSPAVRPHEDGPALLVQTHMSWVVLDRRHALKLKKPVRYPPLFDNTSLAARERDAHAESRLNRRLAPAVYLGLLAVQWDGHALQLVPEAERGRRGNTIDWVVRMQRLPVERMVDHLIARDGLQPADVETIATMLARFFTAAVPTTITVEQHLLRFADELARHRALLLDPRFDLPEAAAALHQVECALALQARALAQRLRLGHVVDGHGDLRPEHVCLIDPPAVIDCLTFDGGLRQLDPFEEITGLALECERLGAAWVGPLLIERCRERLDDDPGLPLLALYTANASLLRARLAIAHLLDAQPVDPPHWRERARWYLRRALQALPALALNA